MVPHDVSWYGRVTLKVGWRRRHAPNDFHTAPEGLVQGGRQGTIIVQGLLVSSWFIHCYLCLFCLFLYNSRRGMGHPASTALCPLTPLRGLHRFRLPSHIWSGEKQAESLKLGICIVERRSVSDAAPRGWTISPGIFFNTVEFHWLSSTFQHVLWLPCTFPMLSNIWKPWPAWGAHGWGEWGPPSPNLAPAHQRVPRTRNDIICVYMHTHT